MPEPDAAAGPVRQRWWLHGLLFVATCATTFYAGSYLGGQVFSIADGLMFMAAIMGILLVHEMGHFTAARLHRVDASLPYFIPLPLVGIGTMGAVIRMRQPPDSREALIDIGAAGPLAGVLVAIPVCWLGLELSAVTRLDSLPPGAMLEGNSLLYLGLKQLAHPELGPGDEVMLHPVALAGWLGLLITSLNLMPAGQLDGGHVLYGLLGDRAHRRVARWVQRIVLTLALVGLGCSLALKYNPAIAWLEQRGLLDWALRGAGMMPWIAWTIILRFVGGAHPPVAGAERALSGRRRALGWAALGLLVITFSPVFMSQVQL